MKKVYCLLFLLIAFGLLQLDAQPTGRNVSKSGTTAATFLQIPVGARGIGMGGAFVGTADDITSLYWNPAGSARLQNREVMFSHIDWIADANFDYGAVGIPLADIGTIGLSFTSVTMDEMLVRTVERPEGTGELFSAGSIAIGIHYARNLTDRFSIGFTGKYIHEHIWDMSAQGFALDFGTLFTTDFLNGMRIGAVITNFGTDMQLSGRNTLQYGRIDDRKQGSNERIPFHIEMEKWPLPLNFQFGVATDFIKNDVHLLTIAIDALHPSNNFQSINVGGEYGFQNLIFLRGGFHSLFLQDNEGGLTLGLGLLADLFGGNVKSRVDYAYRDFGRLREVHVFNVSVLF